MRIRTIAKEYDGRWMIVSAIALAMLLFGTRAHAQIVSSNPLEYVALAEGNDLINGQIKHQIEDQQRLHFFKTPSQQSLHRYTNGRRSTIAI